MGSNVYYCIGPENLLYPLIKCKPVVCNGRERIMYCPYAIVIVSKCNPLWLYSYEDISGKYAGDVDRSVTKHIIPFPVEFPPPLHYHIPGIFWKFMEKFFILLNRHSVYGSTSIYYIIHWRPFSFWYCLFFHYSFNE